MSIIRIIERKRKEDKQGGGEQKRKGGKGRVGRGFCWLESERKDHRSSDIVKESAGIQICGRSCKRGGGNTHIYLEVH